MPWLSIHRHRDGGRGRFGLVCCLTAGVGEIHGCNVCVDALLLSFSAIS